MAPNPTADASRWAAGGWIFLYTAIILCAVPRRVKGVGKITVSKGVVLDADSEDRRAIEGNAGLCSRCTALRILRNPRGSTFVFCQRSYDDSRFARFPPLPVLACSGFADVAASSEEGGTQAL